MKAEKEQIVVDMNNDYLKAVIKSFHQFLIEEATGAMNADLRLEEKLKAARTLFEQERFDLKNGNNYCGRFNAGNVELIFNAKE